MPKGMYPRKRKAGARRTSQPKRSYHRRTQIGSLAGMTIQQVDAMLVELNSFLDRCKQRTG